MPITLRPHQTAACNAVEAAFGAGIQKPLVDACVGSGKSLIFAELARREIARGGRMIIGAHTRELVEQNAAACRMLGLQVGVNASALHERTWRGPVISAGIQSIYKYAHSFGQITLLGIDEAHLVPHAESGMYRELHRALGYPRLVGGSGTVFRLQGGSLVQGEGAPFDRVVYEYSILDGIRDGYLVPAFSIGADDKIDPSKLRTGMDGDYTGSSQDAQMIAAMDNHIAQMVHHGRERRAWLVFEASVKATVAMGERMNAWGIPTGVVLGQTKGPERKATIEAFRSGRLRALVNVNALTTGFDVQEVDLLVMRRRTMSLGLYVQMIGRLLRTVGGTIAASIAAGKPDGAVLDFAGNIDQHGPLDCLQVKDTKPRLVSCEECGKRVPAAALKCWSCDAVMQKNCPACLEPIDKGELDCPHCGFDMRAGPVGEPKPQGLSETPSGAALIAAYKTGTERAGGWLPIRKVWAHEVTRENIAATDNGERWTFPVALAAHAPDARWLRGTDRLVAAVLLPNGGSRSTARQVTAEGGDLIVPLPAAVAVAAEAA